MMADGGNVIAWAGDVGKEDKERIPFHNAVRAVSPTVIQDHGNSVSHNIICILLNLNPKIIPVIYLKILVGSQFKLL